VSQFIADSRGTGPLYEALHQVFDKDYPPTAVHKFFAALPQTLRAKGYRPPGQIIISVTYDDLLERALRDAGESFDVISYIAIGPDTGKFRHRLPNGENRIINAPNSYLGLAPDARTTILKIHGSVDRENPEQDSFVINEEEFIKFMTRTDISHLLPIQVAARLRRSNFLFLGYSLRDWSVRVILQRIWGEQRLKYESWAVMLKPDEADLMFWRKRDVRIFNMPLQQYIENLKRHLEGSENSN